MNTKINHEASLKKNPALTYLKVKIKSLAAEARIIRREEFLAKKHGNRALLDGLHAHRTFDVRLAARRTLLAYGYLRGRWYGTIESNAKTALAITDIKSIARMVVKYGPEGSYYFQSDDRINEAMERLDNWFKT